MKNETAEVNSFFKLCKKQQACAEAVNENIEIVRAQQSGRATLSHVRQFLAICDDDHTDLVNSLKLEKHNLAYNCAEYFAETSPLNLKKKAELKKVIKANVAEIKNLNEKLKLVNERTQILQEKEEKTIAILGDCDDSLEEALVNYRNVVEQYNKTAEKLNKFKGVNIELLNSEEFKKAPLLKINENFAYSDESDLLI